MSSENLSRRQFVVSSAQAIVEFTLLGSFASLAFGEVAEASPYRWQDTLLADPFGLCDLPPGFTYKILARTGDIMADGRRVLGRPDGMGCFPRAAGGFILVKNHELWKPGRNLAPLAYDPNCLGGTTTLELDADLNPVHQYQSLAGTLFNCSGGVTPWGTWLSCEEHLEVEGGTRPHGYVFEVDPYLGRMNPAVPLYDMGRFAHEAAHVDRRTGIVYMTEDASRGRLFRFIPNVPGRLAFGGRLECLAFNEMYGVNTRPFDSRVKGKRFPITWVSHEKVARAAKFERGEGIIGAADGIYFSCTSGGPKYNGQIFRLLRSGGLEYLELVTIGHGNGFASPDAVGASPWGDLVVCEDKGEKKAINRVFAIRPDRRMYRIFESKSEACGACFSPDGRIMFINLQDFGFTIAVTGPWMKLSQGALG